MPRINCKSLGLGALALALTAGTVACQRNPENVQAAREEKATNSENPNQDQLLTPADRDFMKRAEDSDIKERDLGRVMMEKSQNSNVRDYAKMLADDHDKDLKNVVNLLEDKGIHQPKNMVHVNNEALTELNSLSGPALDKRFMEMMVQNHQKDVAEYTKEVRSGEDPQVRDYAARTLTTLDKHLKKAEDVQAKLDESSGR
jgi:putative membrane protein